MRLAGDKGDYTKCAPPERHLSAGNSATSAHDIVMLLLARCSMTIGLYANPSVKLVKIAKAPNFTR